MFWNNNKINPIASSIAENIKKKNVRDKIFKLSKVNPIIRVKAYKVIHANSAVNNRWRAVFVLMKILKIINNKKKKSKFKLSTIK
jgi:hypothetical protein